MDGQDQVLNRWLEKLQGDANGLTGATATQDDLIMPEVQNLAMTSLSGQTADVILRQIWCQVCCDRYFRLKQVPMAKTNARKSRPNEPKIEKGKQPKNPSKKDGTSSKVTYNV